VLTQQSSRIRSASARTVSIIQRRKTDAAPIPATRVKELLWEIAIALHSTRVVSGRAGANVPKKG
jgi:hypothetical protein